MKSNGTEKFVMTSPWLQRPSGDPIGQDPPAWGYHTGFIRRGFLPPMGDAGERPEFDVKPPLGAP